MAIKQISVFLENKPGMLDSMTEVLAGANVDIRALSLAETKDFGIVRMIVDDINETAAVLKDNGYINSLTPVIAVLIPDEVGGLNRVLKTLTIAQVNVEYMYASLAGKESDDAYMIFRVEETERA
ncbi:MAG: ACT domain-containing protein, partial [Lachnospiraceae bacterium]|nr:ACT domain-containing protein [Lachnospiraceae bacterium]